MFRQETDIRHRRRTCTLTREVTPRYLVDVVLDFTSNLYNKKLGERSWFLHDDLVLQVPPRIP